MNDLRLQSPSIANTLVERNNLLQVGRMRIGEKYSQYWKIETLLSRFHIYDSVPEIETLHTTRACVLARILEPASIYSASHYPDYPLSSLDLMAYILRVAYWRV